MSEQGWQAGSHGDQVFDIIGCEHCAFGVSTAIFRAKSAIQVYLQEMLVCVNA